VVFCQGDCGGLSACGDACYDPTQFQCYDQSYLCRTGDLLCGTACYDTRIYACYDTTICLIGDIACAAQYVTPCSPSEGTLNCVCDQVNDNPPTTTIEYWQSQIPGEFTQNEYIVIADVNPSVGNLPVREALSTSCIDLGDETYEQYIWGSSTSVNITVCVDSNCTNCYDNQVAIVADGNYSISLETYPLPTKGDTVELIFYSPNCTGQIFEVLEFWSACYLVGDVDFFDTGAVSDLYGLVTCDSNYVYQFLSSTPDCAPFSANYSLPVGVCVNDGPYSYILMCAGC